MNPYRTFALQVSDRKRNRILWGHAQQQMDVVRHRMPFQHLDTFLLTQLPQYLADLTTPACKKLLLPVLWYQHHMILAVPFHMGLTLPIFHLDLRIVFLGIVDFVADDGLLEPLAFPVNDLELLTAEPKGFRFDLRR